MPLETVHAEAHCREHKTTREELERLDTELGHPAWDPHRNAIPATGCSVPSPVANRGRTSRGRLTLGSVADRVLHGSSMPILLVRAS
jgi:Mn-dependent DtxR family transcriptional regulator